MKDIACKIKFISKRILPHPMDVIQRYEIKNLTAAQIPIAKQIIERPGICADEICSNLALDKATIAIALKKMINLELVIWEKDNKDKRKKKLYPSNNLNDFSKEIIKAMSQNHDKMLKGFSKQELEVLNSYLERIKFNLTN